MDFEIDEDQEEIRALARRIIADHSAPERLTELEAERGGHDAELYRALGGAGLLGLALPEDVGGAGLGLVEVALVAEEIGRHAAAAPVLESVVLAALPIEAFGSAGLRRQWLPRVATGEVVLTAALVEETADPLRPATSASRDGEAWRLDGLKVCVPAGLVADAVLVPATTDGGTEVFLVHSGAAGLTISPQQTSSGRPMARIELKGVTVPDADRLTSDLGGDHILAWMLERATAALCVLTVGACEEAIRLTAEYVKQREQFGRPLASFQAVGQRVADAFIDTQAIKLTAWQAIWRLSVGLPATDEVAIAKFWASEGGQRVVHAAQHLHGGVGVDRSYPVHRYFLLAKQVELTLGAGSAQLAGLGCRLAAAANR